MNAPRASAGNDFYAALKARAGEVEAEYRRLTPASGQRFEDAKQRFPGGYTRDSVVREPYGPFVVKGEGAVLTDLDGREIVDMWFNATSLPLGHADPRVVAAIEAQARAGSAFFAMTERELDLADVLCERLPVAERVRFANSGSEAVMIALRLARAETGRDLIVKFEGSYHGSYDDAEWSVEPSAEKMGDPLNPTPVADSGGMPDGTGRVLVLPYNNPEALRRVAAAHAGRIAGVIVEPLANRMGMILPDMDFLAACREVCDALGAVLIFDEVISFRVGYSGVQGHFGLAPDLTTLGKVIGGGLPIGAVAGRARVMDRSALGADRRVTHAGTFNANPLAMAAGKATLDALTPEAYDRMNAMGATIRRCLADLCEGLPLQVTGMGSLFKITATDSEIRDYRGRVTADTGWQKVASLTLLNDGFLLPPTLHGCVSTVTTARQADAFVGAFAKLLG